MFTMGLVPRASTLAGVLQQAAERWPALPALETSDRIWRYEEFSGRVDAAVSLLVAHDVGPGDRIAVALGQDAAQVAVPFVASRLGVSTLLLNTASPPAGWSWQLRVLSPRLVLADKAHADALADCGYPVLEVDGGDPGFGSRLPAAQALPPSGHGPASTVLYLGTSGTTGAPKLTCLTERGLLHAASGYLPRTPLEEGRERSMVVLPLHYIAPISTQTVLMPLVGGCTVVAGDSRPSVVADRLATDAITHLDAAPAWLGRLAGKLTEPPRTWRAVVYGGSPMPPVTAHTLAERVPGLGMYDVWGLSEAHGPVTLLRFDPTDPPEPGVVGTPLPGVEVRAVPVGQRPGDGPVAGGTGELWVAGPTVTPGYFGDPEATAAALHDGWLATGDLGSVDADGTVRLRGRRKEMILRGGENIFPGEVSRVLADVPGVADAFAFAVPSRAAGETVAAAVVADTPGVDVAALRGAVRRRIGMAAIPRQVLVIDELPRNTQGKVDTRELARLLHERNRRRRAGRH